MSMILSNYLHVTIPNTTAISDPEIDPELLESSRQRSDLPVGSTSTHSTVQQPSAVVSSFNEEARRKFEHYLESPNKCRTGRRLFTR